MKNQFRLGAALAAAFMLSAYSQVSDAITLPTGWGQLDPILNFEDGAYVRGNKSTTGGVSIITLNASNAPLSGMSGFTWPVLFTTTTPNVPFRIVNGSYTLNATFRNNVFQSGSILFRGSGVAQVLPNTINIWNAFNAGHGNFFTPNGTVQTLFSANLTRGGIFGATTSSPLDDIFAFQWSNPTGRFAEGLIPNPTTRATFSEFTYLLTSTNWTQRPNANFNTRFGLEHTNVPIPPALYLFGTGLLVLGRLARRTGNRMVSV